MANTTQYERNRNYLPLFPLESEVELDSELDPDSESKEDAASSGTFANNMSLPIHRWFRYSAGFSARWVENVIANSKLTDPIRVFDPFAGSATTLLAAQKCGVESWGTEAHPFVYRIACAKLAWTSNAEDYRQKNQAIKKRASNLTASVDGYPD